MERVGCALGDDFLLLEQPWPMHCPRGAETAGVIHAMPCKSSHHCQGLARGS